MIKNNIKIDLPVVATPEKENSKAEAIQNKPKPIFNVKAADDSNDLLNDNTDLTDDSILEQESKQFKTIIDPKTGQEKIVKFDLKPMQELVKALELDLAKLRVVHVAGTNGKGSTCAFISSILIAFHRLRC